MPIQRSEELAPLSREHHRMLLVAHRLRHVLAGREFAGPVVDASGLRAEVEALFTEIIEGHAAIEDELLGAELVARLDIADADAARMTREHGELDELRRAAARAQAEGDEAALRDALARFSELLEAHVRFEDRELFGAFERGLPAEELARIGRRLADYEAARRSS